MGLDLNIYLEKELMGNGIALHIVQHHGKSSSIATNIIFEQIDDHSIHRDPLLRFNLNTAQQFMDGLWQCGIRPSEGTGSAGSLKATQDHLKDMQRIVFDGCNTKAIDHE